MENSQQPAESRELGSHAHSAPDQVSTKSGGNETPTMATPTEAPAMTGQGIDVEKLRALLSAAPGLFHKEKAAHEDELQLWKGLKESGVKDYEGYDVDKVVEFYTKMQARSAKSVVWSTGNLQKSEGLLREVIAARKKLSETTALAEDQDNVLRQLLEKMKAEGQATVERLPQPADGKQVKDAVRGVEDDFADEVEAARREQKGRESEMTKARSIRDIATNKYKTFQDNVSTNAIFWGPIMPYDRHDDSAQKNALLKGDADPIGGPLPKSRKTSAGSTPRTPKPSQSAVSGEGAGSISKKGVKKEPRGDDDGGDQRDDTPAASGDKRQKKSEAKAKTRIYDYMRPSMPPGMTGQKMADLQGNWDRTREKFRKESMVTVPNRKRSTHKESDDFQKQIEEVERFRQVFLNPSGELDIKTNQLGWPSRAKVVEKFDGIISTKGLEVSIIQTTLLARAVKMNPVKDLGIPAYFWRWLDTDKAKLTTEEKGWMDGGYWIIVSLKGSVFDSVRGPVMEKNGDTVIPYEPSAHVENESDEDGEEFKPITRRRYGSGTFGSFSGSSLAGTPTAPRSVARPLAGSSGLRSGIENAGGDILGEIRKIQQSCEALVEMEKTTAKPTMPAEEIRASLDTGLAVLYGLIRTVDKKPGSVFATSLRKVATSMENARELTAGHGEMEINESDIPDDDELDDIEKLSKMHDDAAT